MRAEALERVAPGAGAASKVTPLTSPAAGKRAAGGMALPPRGTAQPTHFWAGARDSQGSGTAQWEGSSLALSGFRCPSWLTARLTQLLGKGPCSLPQALHSGPPAAHLGERAQWDPCLAPRSPGLSLEPWWGAGPSLPTSSLFSRLSLHQARSEVLGAPAWSQGLDPDHKARDPPGISGEMLLAKPPGLQGPDRKPPSLPCGFPAPAKTDPGAEVWDSPACGLLPDDVVQPGSWEVCGHPWRCCSREWVCDFRAPCSQCWGWEDQGSQAGGWGSYLGGHSRQGQPSQELQEASEQPHGRHLLRRTKPGGSKGKPPCSYPGGAPGTEGQELNGGLGAPPHCCPEVPVGGPSIL